MLTEEKRFSSGAIGISEGRKVVQINFPQHPPEYTT